ISAVPLLGATFRRAPAVAAACPPLLATARLAARLAAVPGLAAEEERVADLARAALAVARALLDARRRDAAPGVAAGQRRLAHPPRPAVGDVVTSRRRERATRSPRARGLVASRRAAADEHDPQPHPPPHLPTSCAPVSGPPSR